MVSSSGKPPVPTLRSSWMITRIDEHRYRGYECGHEVLNERTMRLPSLSCLLTRFILFLSMAFVQGLVTAFSVHPVCHLYCVMYLLCGRLDTSPPSTRSRHCICAALLQIGTDLVPYLPHCSCPAIRDATEIPCEGLLHPRFHENWVQTGIVLKIRPYALARRFKCWRMPSMQNRLTFR